MHGCIILCKQNLAETAAVSCCSNQITLSVHHSVDIKKTRYKRKHSLIQNHRRHERSESAREQKIIIIMMYIYHALINVLSAHMIHINLNMKFYTHVEHSPTKRIYIKYYIMLECPPREHQGEGLHSVFQTFAENPFFYPGMIVNAIVYVRRRWCVC